MGRNKPIISHVDLGNTTPVLGLTQYFFGFVVFTYNTMNFTPNKNHKSPKHTKSKHIHRKHKKNYKTKKLCIIEMEIKIKV